MEEVHRLNLSYRLDYWYGEVDKKSDYIVVEPSIDGTYKARPRWLHSRFTLISDKLYVGFSQDFLYLERIP